QQESLVRPDTEGMRITQGLVEDGAVVTQGQALARLARPEGQPGQGPSTSSAQAPSAGRVVGSTAQVGARTPPSAPPLFRMVGRASELQVEVHVVRVGKHKPGQAARVEVAGLGEVVGRLRFIAPDTDMAAQTTRVRISLERDDRLRVGTFAAAIVDVG